MEKLEFTGESVPIKVASQVIKRTRLTLGKALLIRFYHLGVRY